MTFTPDPAELIAADMLTYLDDAARDFDADVGPDDAFSVPSDPSAELQREAITLRVLIIPVGDSETKIERGTKVLAVHQVNVVAIVPSSDTITRAKFNGFVYAVKQSLRGVRMNGYAWSGIDTLTKFDPDQIRTRAQFVAAFQVRYTGIE